MALIVKLKVEKKSSHMENYSTTTQRRFLVTNLQNMNKNRIQSIADSVYGFVVLSICSTILYTSVCSTKW